MDALKKLEHFSLVSKVCTELQNHFGISDKTLAEFIISLHDESSGLQEFKEKLGEKGGGAFPESFVQNLDRLISTMKKRGPGLGAAAATAKFAVAQDSESAAAKSSPQQPKHERAKMFPGLSMADADSASVLEMALDADDGIDEFVERVNTSTARRGNHNDGYDDAAADEYGRRSSDRRRRYDDSEDRQRGRRNDRDDRDDSSRGRYDRRDRENLDETPEVGKIYKGFVTGIKDFGVFVRLTGCKRNREGKLSRTWISYSPPTPIC